jgi:primosomal protein N' (replication factor Y)
VLIGTQMLAKGHDFPAVTLVGVVLAEQGLRVPDFRAAERTFQLLTQVAGRAGRGERPGKVLVQTFLPHHPAVAAALRHDHAGFLHSELSQRLAHRWPPNTFLALLETRHQDQARARSVMAACTDHLRERGVEVRGPMMAGIPLVRGVFRVHALCRGDERGPLHEALRALRREVLAQVRDVAWSLDVDPMGFG